MISITNIINHKEETEMTVISVIVSAAAIVGMMWFRGMHIGENA